MENNLEEPERINVKGTVSVTSSESPCKDSNAWFTMVPRKALSAKRIEYILEWNLLEKSVKRPFYCTVSILHIFVLYNHLGPGTSFYRKS